MTVPVVLTRRDRETELESRGVSGSALDLLLAETAKERHLSRVAYARWAAEEYYLGNAKLKREEVPQEHLAVVAGAILWADMIGIGGRDGVEGTATTRHPALLGCGKGRKHASDGEAWCAAVLIAAHECRGSFMINEPEVLIYMRIRPDGSAISVIIDETLVPVAWARSILCEGLRRAAGVLARHPRVNFKAPPESVAAWAKLYNEMSQE